jgi:signal transduction histidine kinase
MARRARTASPGDLAIAILLTVAGQLNVWLAFDGYYAGWPRPVDASLTAVATLALIARRQAPLAVLLIEFALFPVARAAGAGMTFWGSFVPFFVAVFTVAAEEGRRRRMLGVVLPIAGFALALNRPGTRTFNDAAFYALVLCVSFGLGESLRRFRERALVLARRAVELELEQETALTRERTRIARELHDVISHNVSVAVVQAAGAERVLDGAHPEVAAALRSVQDAGREALAEMQLLLGVLREHGSDVDERAPRPTLARVDALVDQVRQAGLPVALEVVGDPAELPPAVDLSGYRIVQEALTNTLKHAGGAATRVTVVCTSQELRIDVLDEGASETGSDGQGGSRGLLGMRERVHLHGGHLHAGRRDGGGFGVTAVIPLESA